MFLQILIPPTPVTPCSQRSPGCHSPLMSHNSLPMRQTLPGSQCLTAFGFHCSHSTAKLKPLISRVCKLSEYFDLLKISQSDGVYFSGDAYYWFTELLGWAVKQDSVTPVRSFHAVKRKNLLQLQFHRTGTAFWTWSRHSMHCHYRGPRGTVHIWGQEDIISSINLGAYQHKEQPFSARTGFFSFTPFTSTHSRLSSSPISLPCLICWKQQEQIWVCAVSYSINAISFSALIKSFLLPSLQSALPIVIKWKTKLP